MLDLLKVKAPICGVYYKAFEEESPIHRGYNAGGRIRSFDRSKDGPRKVESYNFPGCISNIDL